MGAQIVQVKCQSLNQQSLVGHVIHVRALDSVRFRRKRQQESFSGSAAQVMIIRNAKCVSSKEHAFPNSLGASHAQELGTSVVCLFISSFFYVSVRYEAALAVSKK